MNQISVADFFSSSKAYFIAVDTYNSPAVPDLQTPVHDVKALSAVLLKHHGFGIEPVVHKADVDRDSCIPNPLLNPGSGQLLQFLRSIVADKDDRLLIYFACHGIAMDSEGDPEGYILAADASPGQWDSFIKMSEVLRILQNLTCKHLLLILDCCYAGAFRWAGTTRGMGAEVPKTIYYEKLQQYTGNKAWQVLTSAAHDQKAIDALRLGRREPNSASMLSPFAELMVKALQTGDADSSFAMEPDGLITATELSYYLQESIFENLFKRKIDADKRQLPMLFPVINAAAGLVGKGEFLFQNPSIQQLALPSKSNTNPYKGLAAYTREDNTIFYGRQRVLTGWIDGKTDNIGLIPASRLFPLIILTGPSGIGKSSLAKAGLLAYYSGKSEIALREMRPGKTPWTSNKSTIDEIRKLEKVIVLIDQFEELITICKSADERDQFEEAVLELLNRKSIIITIRSDFENQFKDSKLFRIRTERNRIVHHIRFMLRGGGVAPITANGGKHSGFGQLTAADKIIRYRFIVPPFHRDEIEEIVIQPAAQELLEIKPADNRAHAAEKFVDRIVDDAFQNSGSLPLLSLALSELWEKREDNNLLEQAYDDFGGITGILDRKANEEYNRLNGQPEDQLLFKQLIFRMISFEGGRISKRRVYTALNGTPTDGHRVDELILNTPSRTEKIKSIALHLTNARLIKPDTDESGHPFIEPSHDALLRSWITLTKWLKEKDSHTNQTGQETIVLLRSVADAVNNGVVWANDPRLQVAKQNIGVNLNQSEEQFIRDSIRKKNYNKRIRGWSIGIAASLIMALGIFGWWQAVRSAERAKRNEALYLAASAESLTPHNAFAAIANAESLAPDEPLVYDYFLRFSKNVTNYNSIPFLVIPGKGVIRSLQFDSSRKVLQVTGDYTIAEISMDNKKVTLISFPQQIRKAIYTNAATLLVLTSTTLYKCSNGIISDSIKVKNSRTMEMFTRGNKFMVSDGETIKIFSVNNFQLEQQLEIKKEIYKICISPDATALLVVRDDYYVSRYQFIKGMWVQKDSVDTEINQSVPGDPQQMQCDRLPSIDDIQFSATGHFFSTTTCLGDRKIFETMGRCIDSVNSDAGPPANLKYEAENFGPVWAHTKDIYLTGAGNIYLNEINGNKVVRKKIYDEPAIARFGLGDSLLFFLTEDMLFHKATVNGTITTSFPLKLQPNLIEDIEIGSQNKIIIKNSNNSLQLFTADGRETGNLRTQNENEPFFEGSNNFAFSKDNRYYAACDNDYTLYVWDITRTQLLSQFEVPYGSHSFLLGGALNIIVTDDRKTELLVNNEPRVAISKKCSQQFAYNQETYPSSADGSIFLLFNDSCAQGVFDIQTKRLYKTNSWLRISTGYMNSSADTILLIDEKGKTSWWKFNHDIPVRIQPTKNVAIDSSASPKYKEILHDDFGTTFDTLILSVNNTQKILRFKFPGSPINRFIVSPTGKEFLIDLTHNGQSRFKLFNEQGKEIKEFNADRNASLSNNRYFTMEFSPDGQRIMNDASPFIETYFSLQGMKNFLRNNQPIIHDTVSWGPTFYIGPDNRE